MLIRVLVAGVTITAAITLPPVTFAVGQEPDGISIRLVDASIDQRDDPRAQLYVVDHVAPTSVVERHVQVTNHTEHPVRVDLYAGAALVDGSGFGFGDGAGGNELAEWTTVAPTDLVLDPEAAGVVTVRTAVPSDASEGERYAVIWAETAGQATTGVRTVTRVGVRMYVSVGDGGEPETAFDIDGVAAGRDDDGRPVVIAEVSNTGARALDLTGTVALEDGPGGTAAGPFPLTGIPTLAIGSTASVTVALDPSLPSGPWTARLVVRAGAVERTAEVVLTFPTDAGTVAPARSDPPASDRSAAALVAVVSAVGVLASLARHARRLGMPARLPASRTA